MLRKPEELLPFALLMLVLGHTANVPRPGHVLQPAKFEPVDGAVRQTDQQFGELEDEDDVLEREEVRLFKG